MRRGEGSPAACMMEPRRAARGRPVPRQERGMQAPFGPLGLSAAARSAAGGRNGGGGAAGGADLARAPVE